MKNAIKSLSAFCAGATAILILFIMPNFIYVTGMAEQEVSTLSKAIFIPLFVVGTIISAIVVNKKNNTVLRDVGLLFMGTFVILLAFLNVYHLQMLLPTLKTNSITLVVMWVARGLGGLTGLFTGFVFGSVLTKGIWQYVGTVLGGVIIFLLSLMCPNILPYEVLFYGLGFLTLLLQVVKVFSCDKAKNK